MSTEPSSPPEAPTTDARRALVDRRVPAQLPAAFEWLRTRPFYQAGLQGYSDHAMRIVARRHGSPYCVTEALLDSVLRHGGKGLDAARLAAEDHPIAGQLMGSHPRELARGAEILLELGYDVIDVNLACPVKRIRKQARGGHLLAEPRDAIAILRAVRAAIGDAAPITVKLRRGSDDSPAARDDFFRIFDAVVELGLFGATVHGRTVEQKYLGPSSWGFLAEIVRRYEGFPIFGSGDIFTADSIFAMIEQTGVLAVSVARGAIGNPWIFREACALADGRDARPPTLAEQRAVLETQFALAAEVDDSKSVLRRMRKAGIKFSCHHPDADLARDAFIAVRDEASWQATLDRLYGAPSTRTEAARC